MVDSSRKRASYTRFAASKDSFPTTTTVSSHAKSQNSQAVMSAPVSPQILPRSYLASAIHSQSRGFFFDSYLPSHSQKWPKLETDLSVMPVTGWLQAAAALSSTAALLDDALTALALAHLERREKQRARFQSSLFYSRAMQEFSRRLRDNHAECLSDTTLAGVSALTIYEMQAGTITRANSWLSLVRGAASLV